MASKWIELNPFDLLNAPKASGVYVIYLGGGISYIGSSMNLRNRLLSYRIRCVGIDEDLWNTPWETGIWGFRVKVTLVQQDWRGLEKRLIQRLAPFCNTVWMPWEKIMSPNYLKGNDAQA